MTNEQRTIRRPFTFEGVGIHSGAQARVTVHPAQPNLGRAFKVGGIEIPAHVRYVVDTTRCTTLGRDGAKVATVEHLLSALAGSGVDNCWIEVDGPEIPILDGSALPFVKSILDAGIESQGEAARSVRSLQVKRVGSGAAEIKCEPSDSLRLTVTTDFDDWPDGAATMSVEGTNGIISDYAVAIAPARTFAFRREVEALVAAGLARGGSLDNALIVSPPDTFSSPLRVPSEWCAHKVLDLIGDLALLNARPAITIVARRPGHRLNAEIARAILDQPHV